MRERADGNRDVLQSMEFRLAYCDCDPAGIIYYGAYYPWMERTYNEWCYQQEIRTDQMIDRWGVTSVARASGCEYLKAPTIFDPMKVEMRLGRIGDTSFTWSFDFTRTSDDTLVCVGTFTIVMVDPHKREAVPIPTEFRKIALGT